MSSLVIAGDTSGSVTLQAPAVSGTTVLTLPATSGTVLTTASGTAATATNLAGGSAGTIPYQSAGSTTAMLAVGTAGQVLTSAGAAAPTWATVSAGVGNHEVVVNTGNGFGSTNTLIRRFTTTQSSVGTDITYADSAANGASFTINTTAIYAISYTERLDSANYFGVSVNSNQLSTTIETITAANRIALMYMNNGNGALSVSVTVRLAAGDIVRAHTAQSTTFQDVFAQVFRIRKVGAI